MATHVEVLKVCCQTRSNVLRILNKHAKYSSEVTQPLPSIPRWPFFDNLSLLSMSSRGCKSALINNVQFYHKHNCSKRTGSKDDCCCSESKNNQLSDKASLACWKCGRDVDDSQERYFCRCGVVQPPVRRRSLFDVMEVKETFDVDLNELTKKYRGLQRILHPDKYSQKSEVEKEFSEQHSTLVNRAYNTLQKPLERGLYLLHLNEETLEREMHVSKATFLDEIMTINEDLLEAETAAQIKAIGDRNQAKIDELVGQISEAFKNKNTDKAKDLLLQLKYYSNIQEKVKESLLNHL